MRTDFKHLSILLLILSVLSSIKTNDNYLTHLEGGNFLITNTTSIVQYRCTYGGEPLVIWGAKVDEEIDSLETVEPLYLKEGFTASNLEVESHIRAPRKDIGKLHFKVLNPANGGLSFKLSRNQSFYVDTVLFSTKKSEFSQKIVNNYQIFTDEKQFGGAVPYKEFDFAARTGLFVYEYTNNVASHNFMWDQNTKWADYFSRDEQDIYVNLSPRLLEKDSYEGYGFYVCGGEREANLDSNTRNQFMQKGNYFEVEEEYKLDERTKFEIQFEKQANSNLRAKNPIFKPNKKNINSVELVNYLE